MNRQIFAFIEHPRVLFFFMFFTFCLGIIIYENNSVFSMVFAFFLLFLLIFISFQKFLQKFLWCFGIFWIGFFLTNFSHQSRLAEFQKLTEITNNFTEKVTVT